MQSMDRRILVLGVGNILLQDEGVGVRVVEALAAGYRFSANVSLLDGGTLGLRLLDPITLADHVIVVDAVQWGGEPGTIYRLQAQDLNRKVTFKNSIHQLDLVETLAYADLMDQRPEMIVVGIEPADISPWGLELTPAVAARLDRLVTAVLQEIRAAGGSFDALQPSENHLAARPAI